MSVYEECFKRYGQHSPTAFDHNINIDDDDIVRSNWFVMPVSRTRDSGPLDESNFNAFLQGLGGESETVEVHRFGHWGPGWYEIIIVHPGDEKALKEAYEMAGALQDYPVLDDTDYHSREWNDFLESWDCWGATGFRDNIRFHYKLGPCCRELIDDVGDDDLRKLWMEVASEPYFHESSGLNIMFDDASMKRIGSRRIAKLLWSVRPRA